MKRGRRWSEGGWKEDRETLMVMEYGGKVVEGQGDGRGSIKRIDKDGGRKEDGRRIGRDGGSLEVVQKQDGVRMSEVRGGGGG